MNTQRGMMSNRMRGPRSFLLGRRGAAVVEFAAFLPLLTVTVLGLADLGILLGKKVTLIHIAREAGSFLSRGATFNQTFTAIFNADGGLALDGENGKVVLSEVTLDEDGLPVVVKQQYRGGLDVESAIGTLPPGWDSVPAVVPNGQVLPQGMTMYAVELFSKQGLVVGLVWSDRGNTIISSIAAF